MSDSQNVVPSKLYTTEGSKSQKKTKADLEKEDPTVEDGLAVVGNTKVWPKKDTHDDKE